LNRLALGTVQFGLSYGIANHTGQVTRLEAKSLLRVAKKNGIDLLDTAIAYGDSEKRLGEVGVQGFKLVTKLPEIPNDCADITTWIKRQVRSSLSRLGVSEVYGLLLHKPEQLLGINGNSLYEALLAFKKSGQVQKIGISIYSPYELTLLTKHYRFDIVQAPFNLIDRRLHNTGWLKRLRKDNIEVHTRSAFLQGLLLMEHADIPSKFSQWAGLWDVWNKWVQEYSGSVVEACLAFPLSFPEIDRVIVGIDSISQLEQIVNAAKSNSNFKFPDLQCEDENLINPANWWTL
jgi:aryl-alcohol dehydrogenase-like predicted oxidoreductase